MHRWSKLQKELYLIIDPNIDFQIHCSVYRMQSRMGSTDLPRYWITLNKEIIFDYPCQFVNAEGEIKNFAPNALSIHYPYNSDIRDISHLIREYIDTPKTELMNKHFENDYWGLINILKAADKRIGYRRLEILRKKTGNRAAQKVIAARAHIKK